jgi:hypothetical protein
LYMPVPQTGHVPFVAGLPFFMVTGFASFISRCVRHFRQYASTGDPPLSCGPSVFSQSSTPLSHMPISSSSNLNLIVRIIDPPRALSSRFGVESSRIPARFAEKAPDRPDQAGSSSLCGCHQPSRAHRSTPTNSPSVE